MYVPLWVHGCGLWKNLCLREELEGVWAALYVWMGSRFGAAGGEAGTITKGSGGDDGL